MKLQLDETGLVTGFCTVGDMENSVEYTGELPEGFTDNCQNYRFADGALRLDEAVAAVRMQEEALRAELDTLNDWFFWYDNQCMQFSRAQRLGEPFDLDIGDLDHEARQNQLRIRELKTLLNL